MFLYLKFFLIMCFVLALSSAVFCDEYIATHDYKWLNYTQKDGLVYNGVLKFNFDPQGYVWVGTGNDADPKVGGVSIITPCGHFISYTAADGLPDNRINDILFLPLNKEEVSDATKGGIWFATGYGAAKLDRKGKWTIYDKANSDLPDDRVSSLLLDNGGNIWISTLGGGVASIDIKGKWKVYNRKSGLAGDKVVPSFKDKAGNLWFGIWDGGLSEFDGRKFNNYSMGNSGLVSNSLTSIAQNPRDGKMWFGTTEGISVFDGEDWVTYNSEKDKFLISNFVSSLAFEDNGNLWIGYWGEGVTLLKPDGSYENIRNENSGLIDNHVGAIAIDKYNNKWFGTYKGFSVMVSDETNFPTGKAEFSDFYSLPGRKGTYAPVPENFNTSAYHWQLSASEKSRRVNLSFALPIDHYGKVKWSYSAFFGEGAAFKPRGMSYSITQDMLGNQWAEFGGEFTDADFLSYGYVTDYMKPEIESDKAYPFPGKIPEDIQRYLISGFYIPSDNPDIYSMAKSIVKETSKGDMYLTVSDIVYSKLFRDMPYDYTQNISENPVNDKFITEDPKKDGLPDTSLLLKKNTGVPWSKARLFCAVCKAAGIPARLVVGNGVNVWSEVWINGIGWVPVETALPVYDYGGANRLSFPKNFSDPKIPAVSISGSDDDTKSIDWYPQVKASFDRVSEKDLANPSRLSRSKLLILKPANENEIDDIPLETFIPLGGGFYMVAEKISQKSSMGKIVIIPFDQSRGEVINYRLLICDSDKQIVDKIELKETGKSVAVEKKDIFSLEVIPEKIENYLILEILNWKLLKEGTEEETNVNQTRRLMDIKDEPEIISEHQI